jgi:CspA family cold shock protein
VRFYDSEKGFGFLTKDEGGDVYVRADALPAGTTTLKPGSRVEFGLVQGRKGDQALQVRVLETQPSVAKAQARAGRPVKKKPEEMVSIVEDLIRLLDGVGEGYRRGRSPDSKMAAPVSKLLRALADELDS